ncbi:hypothetical protein HDV00_003169 [Rhizophlyctis rosea]|nr:hypothetical protein HDV00_003169 [Rhizophlyctis rosea]
MRCALVRKYLDTHRQRFAPGEDPEHKWNKFPKSWQYRKRYNLNSHTRPHSDPYFDIVDSIGFISQGLQPWDKACLQIFLEWDHTIINCGDGEYQGPLVDMLLMMISAGANLEAGNDDGMGEPVEDAIKYADPANPVLLGMLLENMSDQQRQRIGETFPSMLHNLLLPFEVSFPSERAIFKQNHAETSILPILTLLLDFDAASNPDLPLGNACFTNNFSYHYRKHMYKPLHPRHIAELIQQGDFTSPEDVEIVPPDHGYDRLSAIAIAEKQGFGVVVEMLVAYRGKDRYRGAEIRSEEYDHYFDEDEILEDNFGLEEAVRVEERDEERQEEVEEDW